MAIHAHIHIHKHDSNPRTHMTEGLLTQKPGREPEVGQVKCFTVEKRVSKSGKDWIKIKNATPDQGGSIYKIVSVKPTGHTDDYGNISFNIGIEPTESQPPQRDIKGGAIGADWPQNGKADSTTDNARHYMMRAANLLQMAHNAASYVLGKDYTGEDARTLFIQAAREGYVSQMPDKPVSAPEQAKTIFNATEAEAPETSQASAVLHVHNEPKDESEMPF